MKARQKFNFMDCRILTCRIESTMICKTRFYTDHSSEVLLNSDNMFARQKTS